MSIMSPKCEEENSGRRHLNNLCACSNTLCRQSVLHNFWHVMLLRLMINHKKWTWSFFLTLKQRISLNPLWSKRAQEDVSTNMRHAQMHDKHKCLRKHLQGVSICLRAIWKSLKKIFHAYKSHGLLQNKNCSIVICNIFFQNANSEDHKNGGFEQLNHRKTAIFRPRRYPLAPVFCQFST